jgi:hypothetical protein
MLIFYYLKKDEIKMLMKGLDSLRAKLYKQKDPPS